MRSFPFSYYATITGSLAIAVGLVVVSYGHIRTFAIEAGAAPWEAAVIAVTVDALVVLSIAAIGHARSVGHVPPATAKTALIIGIVATTGANIHHGLGHGWAGIVVSLWVPVAAELAYQLAMSAVRIGAHGHQSADTRPAICGGRTIHVATVMSRAAAERAVAEEQNGHEAAVSARPDICGRMVPVANLAATLPMPAPDTRPVICGGRLVSVSEVLARTLAVPPMVARTDTPSTVAAAAPVATGAREHAVMEWLTAPATTATVDTATGADIVELLAESGHGRVSERTGRRILATVRAVMSDTHVAV